MTPIGLEQYSATCAAEDIERLAQGYVKRLQYSPDKDPKALAIEYRTCCESGWDLNPRWEHSGEIFAHLDLNALLFQVENNMAYFAEVLGIDEADEWKNRAEKRKNFMQKYMVDDKGIYWDYNFSDDVLGKVFSVAAYYPMYVGLATKEQAQAAVDMLPRLEETFGVLTCEKNSVKGNFQWNYPNGWACLQYIMVVALERYGFHEEAKRIAGKYITVVDKVFAETGNLWEKYNVVEGNVNVVTEDEMPAMMGWTAGVYLALQKYL
jgi:alpha,alpha-trehalase